MTLGATYSDRVARLADGSIRPRGVDLTVITGSADEVFFRMLNHCEFDIAEMSLAAYVMKVSRGDEDLMAIPVFPSRAFRHGSVYVREDSSWTAFEQLGGSKIGTPEYQMTSNIWVRDLLADNHGVEMDKLHWFVGGLNAPGRRDRIGFNPPPGLSISRIPAECTLAEMLLDGNLDAIISPDSPAEFDNRGGIRRILSDSRAAEIAYYNATGIFPIMHLVVIRREVHDRYPWVARELYLAFETARVQAFAALRNSGYPAFGLAWLVDAAREERELLGADFWTYGLAKNHEVIQRFIRSCYHEGLLAKRLEPRDLFAASAVNEGDYT